MQTLTRTTQFSIYRQRLVLYLYPFINQGMYYMQHVSSRSDRTGQLDERQGRLNVVTL